MSAIARVHVKIDAQWQVAVTLPAGAVLPVRILGREKVPNAAVRDMPLVLPWPPLPGGAAVPPNVVQAMADRFRRIAQRSPVKDAGQNNFDVVEAGRHLFETLFGGTVWPAIVAATSPAEMIELALEWSKDDHALHRLNWEMMHGPAGFLSAGFNDPAGKPVRVVITRVVAEATYALRTPAALPRILFVIGRSLGDQKIKAGAELFGLLRQIQAREVGGTMEKKRYLPMRVLQEASPSRLQAVVREFLPDIVHIISHGQAEPNQPATLLLQPDPGETKEQWKDAGQLISLLTVDAPGRPEHGQRPLVAVLSACFTGVAGRSVVGAPHHGGSLAGELVAGGIPVVVGMAGEVADQACRLFTRVFGGALVYGQPFLAAMEAGRRAAFTLGEWPKQSVDWAFPTLYRATAVPATLALTARDPSEDETWLKTALGVLNLDRKTEPVLAARFELLDVHYERLRRGDPGALVVLGEAGSGKSRLLRELAAQAVAEGHLPLLIAADDDPPDFTRFKDLRSVWRFWLTALEDLCQALKLDYPNPCHLQSLDGMLDDDNTDGLAPEVQRAAKHAPKSLRPLLRALQLDLGALLAAARALPSGRHGPDARAWLILDHLHLYAPELQPGFFDRAVTPFNRFGLSDNAAEPLPVVMAFDPADRAAQGLKPVAEGKHRSWMVDITLAPFAPDGTDVLYYSRVLLNPHDPALYKSYNGAPISEWPWVIDPEGDEKLGAIWLGKLRHRLRRQPKDFVTERFYQWVEDAADASYVRKADDEEKLKQLQL